MVLDVRSLFASLLKGLMWNKIRIDFSDVVASYDIVVSGVIVFSRFRQDLSV